MNDQKLFESLLESVKLKKQEPSSNAFVIASIIISAGLIAAAVIFTR